MANLDTNPRDRSVGELEREVDRERSELGATIDALRDKASLGNIIDQVVRAVGENGGEVSRNLGRSLRDNPVPALLTGVGLAWLMAGSGRRSARDDWRDDWYDERDRYARYGATEPVSSVDAPAGAISGGGMGLASTDEQDDAPGLGDHAAEAAQDFRDRAADTAYRLGDRAADTAHGFRDRAADFAGSAQDRLQDAGDRVRGAGDVARHEARRLRRRASRAGHDARRSFDHLLEDQPLVLGALALALGAAVGGALPNSRTEDRMFGERAERTRRGLRDVVEDEGRKVGATVGAAAGEAQAIADETAADMQDRLPSGGEMAEAVGDRVENAARRVRDAAAEEAERQRLGEPGSSET